MHEGLDGEVRVRVRFRVKDREVRVRVRVRFRVKDREVRVRVRAR